MFIAIGIIGLSGIIAQVVILRELLVSFQGNELTLGIILGNWLLAEALGAFFCGRYIERLKDKERAFLFLQALFSLSLPLAVYFIRVFKTTLGFSAGIGLGLRDIFISSFLLSFFSGFSHGGLFSCCCALDKRDDGIARVYAWEIIGTIIGGIALTYLLIPRLNSFQISFGLAMLNLVVCLVFARLKAKPRIKYACFFIAAGCLLLAACLPADSLQKASLKKQYQNSRVIDCRNSLFGNICLTSSGEQRVFYYNGIPGVTLPYADQAFAEEYANFALGFHPGPKDILVINSAVGGLLDQMLKHPLDSLDYIELDPVFISMLKEYPAAVTARELSDPRVKVINTDARAYLNNTLKKYDLIILGNIRPRDLTTNRFFTLEFFQSAKARLRPEGIIALTLPGSLTYISGQLRDLNFAVINSVKPVYAATRVIPGDYNLVLASDSPRIMDIGPVELAQRLSRDNIPLKLLQRSYLEYRLDKRWKEWFDQETKGATRRMNRDLTPFALFESLLFWNRQFASGFSGFFKAMAGWDPLGVFAVACLAFLLAGGYIYIRKGDRTKSAIRFAIFSSGFYGMAASLILIFAFQVRYGYLYQWIGLLISANMAGMACGSVLMIAWPRLVKPGSRAFIRIEGLIVVYTLFLGYILGLARPGFGRGQLIFAGLIFIAGVFPGLEFPLACRIYGQNAEKRGKVSGELYLADLAGGWLAGLLTGVIFLPLLGALNALIMAALIKAVSLLFMANNAKSGQ